MVRIVSHGLHRVDATLLLDLTAVFRFVFHEWFAQRMGDPATLGAIGCDWMVRPVPLESLISKLHESLLRTDLRWK